MIAADAVIPRAAMAVMAHCRTSIDDANFFPTPPWAARAIGERVKQLDPMATTVWEPACGAGHMVHGLQDYFPAVWASDLCVYGDHHFVHDFIGDALSPVVADWIITNPPFGDALPAFIRRAYAEARRGVAMFVRAGVLEGQARHGLLYGECPYTVFCPYSERVPIHRGRYEADGTSAAFYGVFVWIKDQRRHRQMMSVIDGVAYPAVMPFAPGLEARLARQSDAAFAVGVAA